MNRVTGLAAAGFLFGAATGVAQGGAGLVRAPTLAEDLQMFSQVFHQIRLNHPDSVEAHTLIMAAIEGMLGAADPHSYAIPATRLAPEALRALLDGKVYPVPIAFRFIAGSPIVAAVTPGSGAAQQDILRGDELLAIDGRAVAARSADELDLMLAGPKGSTVSLTFRRQRSDGSVLGVSRSIRRERVEEASPIPAVEMLDPVTGYIRVTTFMSTRVDEELARALDGLESRGMQRLVLDLRGNGGGSVSEAASVAGAFLPKGAVVYSAERRREPKPDTVRVTKTLRKSTRDIPMVVLVDAGTASASELVAGALQDHDRARIVGRPTFGKALMMAPFPLMDGSFVMLVMGRIRTPCGRIVQRAYRDVALRDYYLMSRAERDTVGRPACTTAAGRRVFGGGGIYPDRLVPEQDPEPLWLARLREDDLPMRWAGGFLTAHPGAVPPLAALLEAPTLPGAPLEDFLRFAVANGATVPDESAARDRLAHTLLLELVSARDGTAGVYTLLTRLDPVIREAPGYFQF